MLEFTIVASETTTSKNAPRNSTYTALMVMAYCYTVDVRPDQRGKESSKIKNLIDISVIMNRLTMAPRIELSLTLYLMPHSSRDARNTRPTHNTTLHMQELESTQYAIMPSAMAAAVATIKMAHKILRLNGTIKKSERCFDCKNLLRGFSSSSSDFYFHFIHRKAIVKSEICS